jgi:putative ABC transport system permease protein
MASRRAPVADRGAAVAPEESMAGLVSDLRAAWRLLTHNRSTSFLILLTFALGLGANVATLAIGRGVLLRPLPYGDPDRLVMIWERSDRLPPGASSRGILTPIDFRELSTRAQSFESIAAIESWSGNLSARFDVAALEGAERLRGAFVTPNFFETLRVSTRLGRTFSSDDTDDRAVIGYQLWQRLFGGADDVIGRHLDLAAGRGKERAVRTVTIIGVLAPRVQFSYPESTEVWLPLTPVQLNVPRIQGALLYQTVARLKPGVALAPAQAEVDAIRAAVAAERKWPSNRVMWLEPVHETAVGAMRPSVQLLGAVAALVFLVSCLNVAALLLTQAIERRRMIAVHLALGASRWRIVRRLVAEGAVLSGMAAVATVVVVAQLEPVLRALMPPAMPRVDEIGVDLLTIAGTTGLVVVAVALSSIIPAWRGSALDPATELAASGRTATASRATGVWRRALVAAQVAVVSVLLVGGGLLLHSFWRLQSVDLGFAAERVFTAEMRVLGPQYADAARLRAFQDELLTRVRALPGVERASFTSSVPLRGVDFTRSFSHRGNSLAAKERYVDPDYFAVMGIPVLAGRAFTAADTGGTQSVVILSQALARHLFRDEPAIGQTLGLDSKDPLQIVGVAGDVRNVRVESEGDLAYYLPRAQQSSELICLVARTSAGTPDLGPAVRAIVRSIDPMQPVMNATTMDGIVADTIADRRFYAAVTVAFGVIALLVAAAGLYGVTSIGVVARTREIGVRIALGADAGRVVRMLVVQNLRPVIAGLALGLLLAFWAGQSIQQFLFHVRSFDPIAYGSACVGVVLFTTYACLWPARRAARVSPVVALRHD